MVKGGDNHTRIATTITTATTTINNRGIYKNSRSLNLYSWLWCSVRSKLFFSSRIFPSLILNCYRLFVSRILEPRKVRIYRLITWARLNRLDRFAGMSFSPVSPQILSPADLVPPIQIRQRIWSPRTKSVSVPHGGPSGFGLPPRIWSPLFS